MGLTFGDKVIAVILFYGLWVGAIALIGILAVIIKLVEWLGDKTVSRDDMNA